MRSLTVSHERYSNTAVILHWLIAVLLIGQLAGGYVMANFLGAGDVRFTIYQVHKTLGLLILGLTLGRILWRFVMPPPRLDPAMARWEKGLAHLTHLGFYFLLLAIPLTGWIMVSASTTGVHTYLFLQESLPFYHLPVTGVGERAEEAHELLSWGAFILLGLHVAGALKHQVIDRAPSFSRMALHRSSAPERGPLPGRLAVVGVILLFLGLGTWLGTVQRAAVADASAPAAAGTAAPAPAVETGDEAEGGDGWLVSYEESELMLTFVFSGNEVTGSFDGWQTDIAFDPQAPQDGRIEVLVDTSTASFSDGSLNAQAQGTDGFNTSEFPAARFVSTQIRQTGEGEFVAEGTLTIKDIARPLSLSFTFAEEDGLATARGETVVDRMDYGIGASGAPSEEWLSHEVRVGFAVTAQRP